jgi:hypothetical protein
MVHDYRPMGLVLIGVEAAIGLVEEDLGPNQWWLPVGDLRRTFYIYCLMIKWCGQRNLWHF